MIKRTLIFFAIWIISFDGFSQWNIISTTNTISNDNYVIQSNIGDGFLGGASNANFTIQHSILNNSKNKILSIYETKIIDLKIYPNPFTQEINIKFSSPSDYLIMVDNSMGQHVKRLNTNKDITLDFSNLSKGLYIIRIIDTVKGTTSISEIIKQ